MSATIHYLRAYRQNIERPVTLQRHAIRAGANETLCGRFSHDYLDHAQSYLPPDCPACAKALEGGQ